MPDPSYSLAEVALDIYRMRFPSTITPPLEKLITLPSASASQEFLLRTRYGGRAACPTARWSDIVSLPQRVRRALDPLSRGEHV